MIVKGLDDKEYTWNYRKASKANANRSKLHLKVKETIRELFPFETICEEVTLPGVGKTKLYADFYLPGKRMMIEADGRQHTEFVPHFHKNKAEFLKAVKRDKDKKKWCELNDIKLINLDYNESIDLWKEKLNG